MKRPVAKEPEEQDFNDRLLETESEASEGVLRHWTQYVYGDVKDLPLPSYMPVFNGHLNVEWVFVIDLDREIFSVDHGAHFKLEIIPRYRWIDALDKTYYEHRLVLPDRLPENAVTSLVVTPDPPDVQFSGCTRNWTLKSLHRTESTASIQHGDTSHSFARGSFKSFSELKSGCSLIFS